MKRLALVVAFALVAVALAGCGVAVPNLVGMQKSTAEAALTAAGFTLGSVTEDYSASIASGAVVSQVPGAGESVQKGSAVAVVISKGLKPAAVPSVVGKTEAEATSLLQAAGLVVTAGQKADSAAKGTVIAQMPENGDVPPGSAVQITVSSGVEMVKVPNIAGMMDPDPVLKKAGLKPKGIAIHGPIEPDAAGIGEAYRQSPKAGALVPKGTTVSYHFWWEAG